MLQYCESYNAVCWSVSCPFMPKSHQMKIKIAMVYIIFFYILMQTWPKSRLKSATSDQLKIVNIYQSDVCYVCTTWRLKWILNHLISIVMQYSIISEFWRNRNTDAFFPFMLKLHQDDPPDSDKFLHYYCFCQLIIPPWGMKLISGHRCHFRILTIPIPRTQSKHRIWLF